MTSVLGQLLGRLPIGWLQLVHRRRRFLAAIAGVAFANLLVFFQLGFLGALGTAVTLPYEAMRADILVSGANARTLTDGNTIARLRMLDILAIRGVAGVTPLFVGTLPLRVEDRDFALTVFGTDPSSLDLVWSADIAKGAQQLELSDTVLIDRGTRFLPAGLLSALDAGVPQPIETLGHPLALAGTFTIGAGFEADGHAVVSDQTFLRLFPDRAPRAPDHLMVRLEPGASASDVLAAINRLLPPEEAKARTLTDAAAAERSFQTVERPVGVIFGFGAVMGVLVGLIIVYQVLSTEVADHLREYATLKAIGYRNRYFVGIVAEQAVILGLLGFIPGYLIASLVYGGLAGATGLPITMTGPRATIVLVGTLVASLVSGLMAARRLASADPADLY